MPVLEENTSSIRSARARSAAGCPSRMTRRVLIAGVQRMFGIRVVGIGRAERAGAAIPVLAVAEADRRGNPVAEPDDFLVAGAAYWSSASRAAATSACCRRTDCSCRRPIERDHDLGRLRLSRHGRSRPEQNGPPSVPLALHLRPRRTGQVESRRSGGKPPPTTPATTNPVTPRIPPASASWLVVFAAVVCSTSSRRLPLEAPVGERTEVAPQRIGAAAVADRARGTRPGRSSRPRGRRVRAPTPARPDTRRPRAGNRRARGTRSPATRAISPRRSLSGRRRRKSVASVSASSDSPARASVSMIDTSASTRRIPFG